jgi:hypothetical protein
MKGERPAWWPDWAGQYVAIIGGGPSLKRSEVDMLKGRIRTVAINEAYQLLSPDVLYSCDFKWWQLRYNNVKNMQCLKVTQDVQAAGHFQGLQRIRLRSGANGNYCMPFLMDEWGEVGSGQGSGFQVVNWMAQMAVKGMALLGFDGCEVNGQIHWHGRHGEGLNNPNNSTFIGWKNWMENAAPKLQELNIDMVNCSAISAIGCFPKITVEDTLRRWNL